MILMNTKYITQKVALKPNKDQESVFRMWAGAVRFIFNWGLGVRKQVYNEYKSNISVVELNKLLNYTRDNDMQYAWLANVQSETRKQALKDMDNAFNRFFKLNKVGFPRFKSKKRSKQSFYVRYDKLKSLDDRHIVIPSSKEIKVDMTVKTYEKVYIPNEIRNPRISFDGKYWYLTFAVELRKENLENLAVERFANNKLQLLNSETTPPIGIDLGIIHTVTISNGKTYENINKHYKNVVKTEECERVTDKNIRLRKKLKRLQRKVSRKYELNKQGNQFIKTKNIIKLESQIKLIHRRIKNIRNTYINQMTTEIVKTKPLKVVMEDLRVSNMLLNKRLAKSIQDQAFYEIRRQMEYKCDLYGISFNTVDKFFPSSKLCSRCGCKHSGLELKDRVFECPQCGYTIDRDLNAAINLSKQ